MRRRNLWKDIKRIVQFFRVEASKVKSPVQLNFYFSKIPYLTIFYLAYCVRPEIILNFKLLGYIMIFELAFRLVTKQAKN